MLDGRSVPVFSGGAASHRSGTGFGYYRGRYIHETENMPGLWESLSSDYEPGILFRSLPELCQAEIRAGTKTQGTAEKEIVDVRNLKKRRLDL